jgi:hypothetical protein
LIVIYGGVTDGLFARYLSVALMQGIPGTRRPSSSVKSCNRRHEWDEDPEGEEQEEHRFERLVGSPGRGKLRVWDKGMEVKNKRGERHLRAEEYKTKLGAPQHAILRPFFMSSSWWRSLIT